MGFCRTSSCYCLENIRFTGFAALTAVLTLTTALTFGMLSPASCHANSLMPDFANISTDDWYVDRYAPHAFANVGTVQGRDNVLGITITSAEGYDSRPVGNQDLFYDTQGRDHVISGGIGSILAADLYIPATWADASQGVFRTDMWGVMTNGDYPIIGFTNYGDLGPRYRVWDEKIGWVDLSLPVAYNAWTSLAIQLTGSSYIFSINGTPVYTDTNIDGSTSFMAVDMQAYNFYDTKNFPGVNAVDYTAYWSNTPAHAPIPPSVLLLGTGLFALGLMHKFFKD